jgi:hypothetical protein
MKNMKNTRLAGSSQTVHNHLADCPPQADRAVRTQTREHENTYPSMDLPNVLSSWGKVWGRCEESLEDAIPQNLRPQTK